MELPIQARIDISEGLIHVRNGHISAKRAMGLLLSKYPILRFGTCMGDEHPLAEYARLVRFAERR